METNAIKERYSDAELEEFKALILDKIAKAERDLEIIRGTYLNHAGNGTEDTSPTFKPFEEGSETMSKEANAQLAARQEKFIRDLRNALVRIENKTYGICRVTGKLISRERLLAVPHATFFLTFFYHCPKFVVFHVNICLSIQNSGIILLPLTQKALFLLKIV